MRKRHAAEDCTASCSNRFVAVLVDSYEVALQFFDQLDQAVTPADRVGTNRFRRVVPGSRRQRFDSGRGSGRPVTMRDAYANTLVTVAARRTSAARARACLVAEGHRIRASASRGVIHSQREIDERYWFEARRLPHGHPIRLGQGCVQ